MQNHVFETTEHKTFLPYAPIVLVRDLLTKWLVVLVAVVTVSVAAYIFSEETYKPVYQTEATLVITSRETSTTVFSNLKSTKELAAVFSSLLNSSTLQKVVLEDLGMSSVDCYITANAIDETNLMTIRVQSGNPRTAFLVLRSLIKHHEIVTFEVMGDVIVEVLRSPTVPTVPINSAASTHKVEMAAVASAVIVSAAILFFSYTSDKVRSKLEAERKLKCFCLGEIYHEKRHKTIQDLFSRKDRGLAITNADASFRFVETIRKMRARVEQYMDNCKNKCVMITSAAENEGKSTIATNLALSLAKKHKKVLLIDLDLRKPACHKVLNQPSPRLTTLSVILGKAKLADAVVEESLSGLHMLLEQSERPYPPQEITKLISDGRFAALIEEAKAKYEYVVVDMPPMLAETDAEYVMEHVDASLLVVRQNHVSAERLNKTIATLEKGRAKLLGCVVNNVYTSGVPLGTNTAYGYGYGYGEYKSYGK